jgi:hypothetical protein
VDSLGFDVEQGRRARGLVMPRYRVYATAEGSAQVEVEAESEDAAETLAYAEHLTGIMIEGGEANWTIEHMEEIDEDTE